LDNSAAFSAAVSQAGASTPISFPPGKYLWNNPAVLHLGAANCNVNLLGASQGGTVLLPNFSNNDAVAFVDPVNESPANCDGRIKDIAFIGSYLSSTNLNLVHVSNIDGITIQNVSGGNRSGIFTLGGAGNSTIDLDAGTGSMQFTERTQMLNIQSFYVTNMLTLDGKERPARPH
jgi:hypothetical protein